MSEIAPGHWRCPVCSETPTQEQVIRRLRQHRGNQARLRICEQRREAMTDLAAARLGAGGGRGTGGDPVGGRASLAADLDREIAELRLAVVEIEAALGALDETGEQLLRAHIVDGRSAAAVASEMSVSRRQFYTWRARALDQVIDITGIGRDENRTLPAHFPHTSRTTG